jgi:hypothetical protein
MIIEQEHLPHPEDDADTGYADEEELDQLPGKINLQVIQSGLKTLAREAQEAQQEMQSEGGLMEPGEVSDPDDDDYAAPDDLFGPEDSEEGD